MNIFGDPFKKFFKEHSIIRYTPKTLIRFIIINFLISATISFFFCMECFASWQGFVSIFDDIMYGFTQAVVLSNGIGLIEGYLHHKISWIKAPVKRLVVEIIAVFIYSFIASFLVIILFYWFWGYLDLDNSERWSEMIGNTILPITIAYIITFFFTARSFLLEWRQSAVNMEKLKTESYAGQYRLLRDQLNPHFLFNSLNALSNLVHQDADKAEDYIIELSRFYRYILDVQDEELCDLDKELTFAERFIFLQKLRFGHHLNLHLSVDDRSGSIPPLTIQLLLENAIKHNQISEEHPLELSITRKGNTITVTNNKKLRIRPEGESIGVGLVNIKERYKLLQTPLVEVHDNEETFEVKIPVLNLEKA